MNNALAQEPESLWSRNSSKPGIKKWFVRLVALGLLVVGIGWAIRHFARPAEPVSSPILPSVSVSTPLQRDLDERLQFLGQFSAVENVELRAQVGGTLIEIGFKDGDIVKKDDLLFVIDPVPYEIKLSHATAQLAIAEARFDLASRKLDRAESLTTTGGISREEVDQRVAEKQSAHAAVDDAKALVRDARFDLNHCRIKAPFTGRIGSHLVSKGNLVAGSRAGSGASTLLATIVSLDPVYLSFDMSEAEYLVFLRERQRRKGPLADELEIALSDEAKFNRQGTLDFIDNTLNRSSGTIRARATVPNADLLLTPGAFARVRLPLSPPSPKLLVPDAAVLADQSEHIALTVGADDVVIPKQVTLGELRGGLRVIRSGLELTDRVVIDGIPSVRPGVKVSPSLGSIRFEMEQD
jgi:RND family efflux transporter MFP subunit